MFGVEAVKQEHSGFQESAWEEQGGGEDGDQGDQGKESGFSAPLCS